MEFFYKIFRNSLVFYNVISDILQAKKILLHQKPNYQCFLLYSRYVQYFFHKLLFKYLFNFLLSNETRNADCFGTTRMDNMENVFFTVKINFNLSISYLTLKTACDYSIWYLTVRIRL